MWIVFVPARADDEPVPFAKFCDTEEMVWATINEVGPRVSMCMPIDDPIATARLLQDGFLAQQERATRPPVTFNDRMKQIGPLLREVAS